MKFLVPIMMVGWIPLNVILFRKYIPPKAVLISVIGGVLFLPVASFDLPVIEYDKETAIAISLLFGIILSGRIADLAFKPKLVDIPIILWCIISPFLSVITNDLGLYSAVTAVIQTVFIWGVYYMAGRIYFTDNDALRFITNGIIIGGLIYIPLVLFEVKMSPQLSNIVYGFFPSSFLQQIRYGGFRPVVFMNHGLMVAMWMAVSFTSALWLYGAGKITEIKRIPMSIIVIMLLISIILCKSANGMIYASLGILGYYYYKKFKSNKIFKFLILIIPVYLALRISAILSIETIINFLSKLFDDARIESLSVRLFQEEVFGRRALDSPFLGWGWMNLAWPRDSDTGLNLVRMIDSFYLVVFSVRGILGLISLYAVLLLGPWKILKSKMASIDAIVLSIVLVFFTIDTLVNGMINPVYVLTAGALISVSQHLKFDKPAGSSDL